MKKLITATFLTASLYVNAQNLPKIQTASVPAPDKVTVDGKVDEWGDYQALNPDVRLFYTIANDDKNLYLIYRTRGPYVNDKLCLGGVTFTISHSLEKKKREKAPDNVSVTFPVVDKEAKGVGMASDKYFYNWSGNKRAGHEKQIDSIQAVANEQVGMAFKEIKVIGIKDVDTLLSIYNADGIKVAGRFDDNMLYNCEIAIPLKYLGLNANDAAKISYNIKMNGALKFRGFVVSSRRGPVSDDAPAPPQMPIITNPDMLYRIDPHDFWGEYTLAKK
jgi:hypothetical protein